jgi:hypothetical protein
LKIEKVRVALTRPVGAYATNHLEIEAKVDGDEDLSEVIQGLYRRAKSELYRLSAGVEDKEVIER